MSHNAPFCNRNVHICAHFCYKMLHCGIWDWCIVGFAQRVYWFYVLLLANRIESARVNQNAEFCWLTHWGRDIMAPISQTTFSNAFSWMKLLNLKKNFTEMCSLWSNWQYGSIGSPSRRETIIWSNVGMLYWRIHASPGLNELNQKL